MNFSISVTTFQVHSYFPTAAKLSNFSETFQLRSVLSNFAWLFRTSAKLSNCRVSSADFPTSRSFQLPFPTTRIHYFLLSLLFIFYRRNTNVRTPCFNSYPASTVLFVPRTLRTSYSENQPYPVPKSVLHQHGTLRTPYSPYPVLGKVTLPRTSIRALRVRSTKSTGVQC